jgi:hypothetical protein
MYFLISYLRKGNLRIFFNVSSLITSVLIFNLSIFTFLEIKSISSDERIPNLNVLVSHIIPIL